MDLIEIQIKSELDGIFGEGMTDEGLLEMFDSLIISCLCEIRPALSPDTFTNIKSAVAFLYPHMPRGFFNPVFLSDSGKKKPTWRVCSAALRLWAVVISEEIRAALLALNDGDFSLIDKQLEELGSQDYLKQKDERFNLVWQVLRFLRQANDDFLKAQETESVCIINREEAGLIVDQWKMPNSQRAGYDFAFHRLNLSLDLENDIETIIEAVKEIVVYEHTERQKSNQQNWNDEERRIFGETAV